MTGNTLNGLLFLIRMVFDFYAVILIIRLILAWLHVDYYNPVTQFVIRLTEPLVKPLKKVVKNIRGLELATLLLLFLTVAIKFIIQISISFTFPNLMGILILAFADTLRLIINTFSLAIILQAIISWVNPASPISYILNRFTSPILRPLQRVIPPISGIDLSPIPALIIMQLMIIVVIYPLEGYGMGVAVGT